MMECEFEQPQERWFKVPNWVEDMPVSVLDVYAFRILCRLARQKAGSRTCVRQLCEWFGIAYDGVVWRRVSRQLRALGALSYVEERSSCGELRTFMRFRWPERPAREPVVENQRTVTGRWLSTPSGVENARTVLREKSDASRRRIRGEAAQRVAERGAVALESEPLSVGEFELVEPVSADVVETTVAGLRPCGGPRPARRARLPEVAAFLGQRALGLDQAQLRLVNAAGRDRGELVPSMAVENAMNNGGLGCSLSAEACLLAGEAGLDTLSTVSK